MFVTPFSMTTALISVGLTDSVHERFSMSPVPEMVSVPVLSSKRHVTFSPQVPEVGVSSAAQTVSIGADAGMNVPTIESASSPAVSL